MMKLVVFFAAAAAIAPASAFAADMSGAWSFQGPKGAASAMTCKLTQSGSALSGSCVTPQGSTVAVSGSVSGDQVEIGYDVAGSSLHIDFKGVIQPDGSIKGTVSASTPPAPFTGTRH